MAILTGKPSSISANTTSSTITLSTTDLISLLDTITIDAYWKDVSRIKSVLFVYRNSSRQKVNLKFTLPSTSSTISINQNSRNGTLTCSSIVITGTANDIFNIPRSSFTTASEFDLTVTDGYVVPGLNGVEAILWVDPITSASSTYVAELDGGIYKNGGPTGPSAAYDLILKSSQELSSAEGYIEIDAVLYSSTESPLNSIYSYGYGVGLNSGDRGISGNYDNIDFAVVFDGFNPSGTPYYQNGILISNLPVLNSPTSGVMPGMPNQSSYKNKIRIQLKNNNVEFFLNNVRYDTLVGVLTSATFPIFAEVSLKNSYIEGQPDQGSGFPSSRIGSVISVPGTLVRSVDITSAQPDAYSLPNYLWNPSVQRSPCIITQGSYIEFVEGNNMGSPLPGQAFSIRNVGSQAMSGEASFDFPLVEGNPYTVRLYIHSYVNGGANPTISILANESTAEDLVTISSSELSSAVGSFVDIAFTPSVYKSAGMPGGPLNANVSGGVYIISNNTDASNIIRISKIELIEA